MVVGKALGLFIASPQVCRRNFGQCRRACPFDEELHDLYRQGRLVYRARRKDYVERRVDGYVEPEEIFILGTSHYSEISARDVVHVIETVKPECVVVELCRSRAGMLVAEGSEMGLSGETKQDFLKVLLRSLRLGGSKALLAQFLLARLGMPSAGVDFRAARSAANRIGAEVALGDRPIEITLRRALNALSFREQFAIALAFLRAGSSGGGMAQSLASQTVPALEDIESSLSLLSAQHPALYGPLVTERDLYLAWSLKRSKAVGSTRRVVGIVGQGHLTGVVGCIDDDAGNNDNPLRFKDLVALPPEDPVALRIVRRLTIDSAIFAVGYGVYLHLQSFLRPP